MITFCESTDDEHAPFPHRLVIPVTPVVVISDTGVSEVVYCQSDLTFVICAHCGHWIERWVPRCKCRQDCHRDAIRSSLPIRDQNPYESSENAARLVL